MQLVPFIQVTQILKSGFGESVKTELQIFFLIRKEDKKEKGTTK